MQKLALETKLLSEYEQRIAELEEQHTKDQATIASQASQIEYLASEIDKKDNIINSFDVGKIVDCVDKYNADTNDMLKRVLEKMNADGNVGLAEYFLEEFEKKDKFISDLIKQVNFLSLSATKKSERYVPKDERGLAEGQTIDEEDNSKKHRKKEDAKARGNNGARHNPHNEVPCMPNVIDRLPDGFDENDLDRYEIIEKRQSYQLVYVPGYFRKQYYRIWKVYDKKENVILSSRPIETALRGSVYGNSLIALIIVDKFGWYQTITVKVQQLRNMGFDANESTLNGIINKLADSQFFRNLYRVLYLAVMEDIYSMMDETRTKVRIDYTKIDAEFIKECWIWGIYAVTIRLIWYFCDEGSRRDEIGYELAKGYDHPVVFHTDGKSCYRNIGKEDQYENVLRLSCLQHQKRRFDKLEDPRAKQLLEMFRNLYHLDHQRVILATEDELKGNKWSEADHIRWRRENMYPAYMKLKETMIKMLETSPKSGESISQSSEQPLSAELEKAIKYALNESKDTENIFNCDILCDLDTNAIERINRAFSYHRKMSQAFGSMKAAENQLVFTSLLQSAKLHGINLYKYINYLLEIKAKIRDSVVTDKNSKDYEFYRNLLPDMYAKNHPEEQVVSYDPPELPTGPLNPNSQRCGYKKHHGNGEGAKTNPSHAAG